MIPRTTIRPPSAGRGTLRWILAAAALFMVALAPVPAAATLDAFIVRPESPTTCDSVYLVVTGSMPDPCYHVIGAEIEGPVELPTMGPIPTYGIRIRITVQEPNPLLEIVCPTVIQPYSEKFALGRLAYGTYWANATEYLVPFTQDSSAAPKDSSKLDLNFMVGQARDCPPREGCYILGFGPEVMPHRGLFPDCNAAGQPGGRACFDVTLYNPVPVGGVQTTIDVLYLRLDPNSTDSPIPASMFEPISVEPISRAGDFQVAWTSEGSRVTVILFSPTGGEIMAGSGPILHVCYAIGAETPEGTYPLVYHDTVVADPAGEALPACPTFAPIVGHLCVFTRTCDVNGDGSSDILDIVRLVHCALAGHGGTESCPDSIAARSDCNEDGSLDVRDVICCVRKILAGGGWGWGDGPPPDSTNSGATRIGFLGPAEWSTATEGRATISIEPGDDYAGTQFVLSATGGARVRSLSLRSGADRFSLDWSAGQDGTIRAMLYRTGAEIPAPGAGSMSRSAAAPISIEALLEPTAGASGTGRLEIAGVRSATGQATAAPTVLGASWVIVPASPAPGAPSVMAPRPNPFVTETDIGYALPSPARVTLRIFDASGRFVRTLVDAELPAGTHRARWDGRDAKGLAVRSGIYFSKFSAGGVERTDRILRLR